MAKAAESVWAQYFEYVDWECEWEVEPIVAGFFLDDPLACLVDDQVVAFLSRRSDPLITPESLKSNLQKLEGLEGAEDELVEKISRVLILSRIASDNTFSGRDHTHPKGTDQGPGWANFSGEGRPGFDERVSKLSVRYDRNPLTKLFGKDSFLIMDSKRLKNLSHFATAQVLQEGVKVGPEVAIKMASKCLALVGMGLEIVQARLMDSKARNDALWEIKAEQKAREYVQDDYHGNAQDALRGYEATNDSRIRELQVEIDNIKRNTPERLVGPLKREQQVELILRKKGLIKAALERICEHRQSVEGLIDQYRRFRSTQ